MVGHRWCSSSADARLEQAPPTWHWTEAHHNELILQHLPPNLDQTSPSG